MDDIENPWSTRWSIFKYARLNVKVHINGHTRTLRILSILPTISLKLNEICS